LGTFAILAPHSTVNEQYTDTGLFNFSVVCATVTNFEVHAGKKFSTQNEECMNKNISPVYLPIHHVQLKYADNNRKS
jgi:hypothetical protein